jgi:RNA polymerase sigma-70 factor (ECF subfamily)
VAVLTEAELIRVYREHTRPLYAYVSRRVGGDQTLAEDIVQDAWLRAVASWPRRGIPEHPLAWLIHVARNLLASHYRRKRPKPVDPVDLEFEESRCTPETPAAGELVNWGLAHLPRRQAKLLEAFYFEDKSTREIAVECGLSERAVEGRLRRARQNLKKRLTPYIESDIPRTEASRPSVEAATALELSDGGKRNA